MSTASTNKLDQLIRDIGQYFYGSIPGLYRYPSEDNPVYRLTFNTRLPAKVIKFGKNVRYEQHVLAILSRLEYKVPHVEFTQEDYPLQTAPFILMNLIPGKTLQEAYSGQDLWLPTALKQAGRFIADLRSLDPRNLAQEGEHDQEIVRLNDLQRFTIIHRFLLDVGMMRPHIHSVLGNVAELLKRERSDFVHRDYTPWQVVTNGISFGVVDWGNSGFGFSLRDLGRFIATTKLFGGSIDHANLVINGFETAAQSVDQVMERKTWERYSYLGIFEYYMTRDRADLVATLEGVLKQDRFL